MVRQLFVNCLGSSWFQGMGSWNMFENHMFSTYGCIGAKFEKIKNRMERQMSW
jgi:hypothetical protein